MAEKTKKKDRVGPIVRSWEIELHLTNAQLDALARGASIRLQVGRRLDVSAVVIVGPQGTS